MSKQVTCLQIKLDYTQSQFPKFKSKILMSNKKNNNRNKIFKTEIKNDQSYQIKKINPFVLELQLDDIVPLKRKNTESISKQKKRISTNLFYNTFIKEKRKREKLGQFRFKSLQKNKNEINVYSPFITQTNFSQQNTIPKIKKWYFCTKRYNYPKSIENNEQDKYEYSHENQRVMKNIQQIIESTPRRFSLNQRDKIQDDYLTLKRLYNEKYNSRKNFISKSSEKFNKKIKVLANDEIQIKPWGSFHQQNGF